MAKANLVGRRAGANARGREAAQFAAMDKAAQAFRPKREMTETEKARLAEARAQLAKLEETFTRAFEADMRRAR